MKLNIVLVLLVVLCNATCGSGRKSQSADHVSNNELYLLIGTYTSANSTGIYVYRFDMQTGAAGYVSETKASNPSYLAVSEDERFVYSVSENPSETAAANAFSFDKRTGVLNLLNTQAAQSADPCYINTDRSGRFVVTANYSGGSISVFPLTDDGTLKPAEKVFEFEGTGTDKNRQEKAHLHCVVFSPGQDYLFAADLGSDKIHKFAVSAQSPFLTVGEPGAFQLEPGSGPRHLCFHPGKKYAYLLGELSGKVTAFRYADGNLEPIQYIASDTTAGSGNKGSADIHVSPDGRFLYASNRIKADGIAIFSIDQTNGTLTAAGYQSTGIHPRNIIITPNGKYLLAANKDSNNIQIFEINKETGLLTENTGKQITGIDNPVCLKFIGTN